MALNNINGNYNIFCKASVLLLSLIFVLLFSSIASAYVDATFNYNEQNVDAAVYICQNSDCSNVYQSGFAKNYTTTSGKINIHFPNSLVTSHGYAIFHTSKGKVPMETRSYLYVKNGNPSYGLPWSEEVIFHQVEDCKAAVDEFSVVSEANSAVPIVVNYTSNLSANTYSAFYVTDNNLEYIPAHLKDEFYSVDTNVRYEVIDNSTGTIIDSDIVYYNTSSGNPIMADDFMGVNFIWTPQQEGNYTIRIVSDIDDNQCSSSSEMWVQKEIEIFSDVPDNLAYTSLQNINVSQILSYVGDNLQINYDKVSYLINNSGLNNVSLATRVNISILDFDNLSDQVYFNSVLLPANLNWDIYETYNFDWIPQEKGFYQIIISAVAEDPLLTNEKNEIDTISELVFIKEKPSYNIVFSLSDSINSSIIIGATILLNNSMQNFSNTFGQLIFNLVPGNYSYNITKQGYENLTGTFEVINTGYVINLNMDPIQVICVPNIVQTLWSGWYNITECSISDTWIEEKNATKYDLNDCGTYANQTVTETQQDSCDYCTPNWQPYDQVCQNGFVVILNNDTNECYSKTFLQSDLDGILTYTQIPCSNPCTPVHIIINEQKIQDEGCVGNKMNVSYNITLNDTACGIGLSYETEYRLEDSTQCEQSCQPNYEFLSETKLQDLGCVGNKMNVSYNVTLNDTNCSRGLSYETEYRLEDSTQCEQSCTPNYEFLSETKLQDLGCVGNKMNVSYNVTLNDTNCSQGLSYETEYRLEDSTQCEQSCTPNLSFGPWFDYQILNCVGENRTVIQRQEVVDLAGCNSTYYRTQTISRYDTTCASTCDWNIISYTNWKTEYCMPSNTINQSRVVIEQNNCSFALRNFTEYREYGSCSYYNPNIIPKEDPDLSVSRIAFISNNDALRVGDSIQMSLNFRNSGDTDFDNVKIRAGLPQLGVYRSLGPFDIDEGDSMIKRLSLEIPYWAYPGEYDLRITVTDEESKRVHHRPIMVVG